MTQEDKDLLLKDLCARLPYGVIVNTPKGDGHLGSIKLTIFGNEYGVNIKATERDYFNDSECELRPYLRSMSNMTEKEVEEYNQCWENDRDDIMIVGKHFEETYKSKKFTLYMHPIVPMYRHIIWLLKNHFDFMGLIPEGLAIEVTEENNPYK